MEKSLSILTRSLSMIGIASIFFSQTIGAISWPEVPEGENDGGRLGFILPFFHLIFPDEVNKRTKRRACAKK